MDMETIIATGILAFVVVDIVILLFLEHKPVRMTYHDQKVFVKEKRGKKNG